MNRKNGASYDLNQLVVYFLQLGTTGFGGPVALIGYMHRHLVEDKKWITEEEYKQGLTLAQLAPGPLAAQLSIYIGFIHYRILGATLAGIAFVLPSFVMVILLGIAYKIYGGLQWMHAVFYGVGAAVTAIIVMSTYKLTVKSVGKFSVESFKINWLLWIFYFTAGIITVVTRQEQVLLFIAAGLLYMFVKAPPVNMRTSANSFALFFLQISLVETQQDILWKIAFFFTRAGAFVFGSGLAIVPFLHAGVVVENRWLTEQQFVDAVAVAMITPGPVVITVGFIGYLIAGFSGSSVAALATFLPCYLFTVIPAPYFKSIAANNSVKAFVDGITAAVAGALTGAVLLIGRASVTDAVTAILAFITFIILILYKKIPEPYIILGAALAGFILTR